MLTRQSLASWSAISRGAVMSVKAGIVGEDVAKVESRIARASYGLVYRTKFIEGQHDPRDKRWCPVEEDYFAVGQVEWFLKKVWSLTPLSLLPHPPVDTCWTGRIVIWTWPGKAGSRFVVCA